MEREARIQSFRINGKQPKIVSKDTRSLSRASGGLTIETTWIHEDSMKEPTELSIRQGHSAGYYKKDGGVSPQLNCMIAGDKTRRIQACAFDGCTAALPGQGHGNRSLASRSTTPQLWHVRMVVGCVTSLFCEIILRP